MSVQRIEVLGLPVDAVGMDQTVDICDNLVATGRYAQHMAVNVAKLVAARDDRRLSEIVRDCQVINADGQGIVWASKVLGTPLPERVAGIDLMHRLLCLARERGYRVYMLGARSEILERAIRQIRADYPGLSLAGYREGYFADDESSVVCAAIREAKPHMLFVGMSSPRKEYWLSEHGPSLGVPLVMGVGGALDVIAGATRRAPTPWQRAGLEWLYRLLQEPRRLFLRYFVSNLRFAGLLTQELARRRLRPRRAQ